MQVGEIGPKDLRIVPDILRYWLLALPQEKAIRLALDREGRACLGFCFCGGRHG
jgi:hypothetical protein